MGTMTSSSSIQYPPGPHSILPEKLLREFMHDPIKTYSVSKSVICFELSIVVKHCSQVSFGFGFTTPSCVQVALLPG
jgi:hypothetical protein